MPSSTKERKIWFDENKDRDYIKKLSPDAEKIRTMPELEYLALIWRLQNQDYLMFSEQGDDSIFINYERFIENPEYSIKQLFSAMNLHIGPYVSEFINDS